MRFSSSSVPRRGIRKAPEKRKGPTESVFGGALVSHRVASVGFICPSLDLRFVSEAEINTNLEETGVTCLNENALSC